MSNISELINKRENLLIEIIGVTADLKEYTKHPVETVDLEQIKYQYGFILRQIKEIDHKISFIARSQLVTLEIDFELLEKQQKDSLPKENFNINDLPKLHFSMFDNSPALKRPFK